MSSNIPSEEDLLKEELGIVKETTTTNNQKPSPAEVVETKEEGEEVKSPEIINLSEQPQDVQEEDANVESTKQEADANEYFTYLAQVFSDNQKGQSERAKEIVDTGNYEVSRLDGTKETLVYHMLNRSQDVEVRSIQRKYNKIRSLSETLRNSYRDPAKDNKYQEFKITDFIGTSLLKGKVTGESTREDVAEAIDEVYEEIFSERFNIFSKDFFGISEEQIENYVYKDLTYLADVAYSDYSTVPY